MDRLPVFVKVRIFVNASLQRSILVSICMGVAGTRTLIALAISLLLGLLVLLWMVLGVLMGAVVHFDIVFVSGVAVVIS